MNPHAVVYRELLFEIPLFDIMERSEEDSEPDENRINVVSIPETSIERKYKLAFDVIISSIQRDCVNSQIERGYTNPSNPEIILVEAGNASIIGGNGQYVKLRLRSKEDDKNLYKFIRNLVGVLMERMTEPE